MEIVYGKQSDLWEVNRARPNAYVYYEPKGARRIIVPVRFKPGQSLESINTKHWLLDDAFANCQLKILHPMDAEHNAGGFGIMHNCRNGWEVNYGALRMLADCFVWESGDMDDPLRWAPNGPVVLFDWRIPNAEYPIDRFTRDWPLRFRYGMPYMRKGFDANGFAHEQLDEAPSDSIGQSLRFMTMRSAHYARQLFGMSKWDELNVY